MKPVIQMEIEINDHIEQVYIYKIDQSSLNQKDSRVICNQFCNDLYKEITINKRSLLFFFEEILIGNIFSIYIFIFCPKDEIININESILVKYEEIKLYSELQIDKEYIIKNLKKIILSTINFHFESRGMKQIKNFLINSVQISNHVHYYYQIKNIELVCDINRSHLYFLNQEKYKIIIEFELGLIKFNYASDDELLKYKKFINIQNLSKIELREEDKNTLLKLEELSVFDETIKTKILLSRKKLIIGYSNLIYRSKAHYLKLFNELFYICSIFCESISSNEINSHKSSLNFISMKLINIFIENSDHNYYNSRIELLSDELKNQNSDNCLNSSEQIDKTCFNSFLNFFRRLNSDNEIDLLEFFGTVILLYHYKELGRSSKELSTTRFSLMAPITKIMIDKPISENIFKSKVIPHIPKYKNESLVTKPLLKPYKKEQILIQENCTVDYGAKLKPKKYFEERDKHIIETINKANKEFFESYENDVKNCNFREEKSIKKVKFHFTIEQFSNKDL